MEFSVSPKVEAFGKDCRPSWPSTSRRANAPHAQSARSTTGTSTGPLAARGLDRRRHPGGEQSRDPSRLATSSPSWSRPMPPIRLATTMIVAGVIFPSAARA